MIFVLGRWLRMHCSFRFRVSDGGYVGPLYVFTKYGDGFGLRAPWYVVSIGGENTAYETNYKIRAELYVNIQNWCHSKQNFGIQVDKAEI